MTEPVLSDDETRTLIDYARQRFAEERWPLSPALRSDRCKALFTPQSGRYFDKQRKQTVNGMAQLLRGIASISDPLRLPLCVSP
jgi:hypothetical protein